MQARAHPDNGVGKLFDRLTPEVRSNAAAAYHGHTAESQARIDQARGEPFIILQFRFHRPQSML